MTNAFENYVKESNKTLAEMNSMLKRLLRGDNSISAENVNNTFDKGFENLEKLHEKYLDDFRKETTTT